MLILLFVLLVELVGSTLIFPIFPLLLNVYDFTPSNISNVIVVFSIPMILGALCIGILSDKYGRKYILGFSLIGATLSYFWTSQAETVFSFLIGRAFSGFFTGGYSVVFASAADLSTKENRIKNMSMLGATIGLSFVIGPIIGGNIHFVLPYLPGLDFDLGSNLENCRNARSLIKMTFIFSAVMSLIASLLIFVLFKETFKPNINNLNSSIKHIFKEFLNSYSQSKMLVPTFMNMVLTAILSGIQVYLGIWMANIFNISTAHLGYFWGATAVIMLLSQIVLRSLFFKVNPIKINIYSWIMLALGLIIMSYSNNFALLCISAAIFYIAYSFLQSSLNTSVSISGNENQQGLVFGINQSINGLGRTFGPPLVGMIITATNSYSIVWLYLGGVAIVMSFIGIIFAKTQKSNYSKIS